MNFFKIIFFLIITSNLCYSKNSSTSMTVTVTVSENYEKAKIIKTKYVVEENNITISNKTPLIFYDEKNNTKNMYIIRETNTENYICTQKWHDGTYIDELKNSYLIDRQTNKLVINHLNENTGKAILCPKINIKK